MSTTYGPTATPADPHPAAPDGLGRRTPEAVLPLAVVLGVSLAGLVLGVGAAAEIGVGSPGAFSALAGGAVGVGVVLLAVLRFPMFVVLAVAVRSAIDVFIGQSPGLGSRPGSGLAALLTVAGVWWLISTKGPASPPISRMRRALLVFGGACLLSVVAVPADPIASLSFLAKMASAIVLVAVLERLMVEPRYRRHLLVAVLVSGVAPISVALGQWVTGSGLLVDQGINRITGTFVHSNPLSLFLTLLLVLGSALLPHVHGVRRAVLAVLLGGAGLALVLTYTRSAWLAALVGLVAVGLLQQRVLIACIAAVVVAGALLVPQVTDRISNVETRRFDSGQASNSFAWRLDYWTESLELARRSPIVGIGIDQVKAVTEERQPPHNDFLRSAVEAGVAGLLAYLGLLITLGLVLRNGYRRTEPGNLDRGVVVGAVGCFAAFLVFSLSGNVISQTVLLWYVLVILALGAASPSPTSART